MPISGQRRKQASWSCSFQGTQVTDLTPIKEMPLQSLRLDYRADHKEFLRKFKGLEIINAKPAAEFWKEVDAKKP